VILNGADGMADMFAKALTMGGTGLGLARQLLASMNQDGQDRNGPARNGSDPAGTSPLNGLVKPPPAQRVPVQED
jgi:hypothetical protein